ncbi:glycosyltransferase family 2 protein [Sphingobacterium sp. UBA5670]|uniref:glycosyltransferase family 2 protein n=1 Tax=Sphingobacterium sp. UBA5670 TaxID=1947502 RepID=UPI0025F96FD7|nr:glycosyltransferase family 2 protein [Sphingobacterium sp. UBA5670]
MNPLISIIIPVYNVEKYLSTCLDSVLNQDFTDFELILVDDGSRDGSLAMCFQFSALDSRIKILQKINGGVSSARNYGIKHAIGKYLCFIDSDDWIDRDFFSSFNINPEGDLDIYIQGYKRVKSGETIGEVGYNFNVYKDFCEFFISSEKINLLNSPCFKLFRNDIIQKNNISFNEEYSLGEDHIFTLQYLLHARSYQISPARGYNYRVGSNENSLTTRLVDIDKFIEYIKFTRDLRVEIADLFNFNSLYRKAIDQETNKWVIYVCHKLFDRRRNITAEESVEKLKKISALIIKSAGTAKNSFKAGIYNRIILGLISNSTISTALKINLLKKILR